MHSELTNCATGPTEMSEHLRYLSKFSELPLVVMPNAGLPILGAHGAHYPLTASELASAQLQFVNEYGVGLVGGCCGTTPAHIAEVAKAVAAAFLSTLAVSLEARLGWLASLAWLEALVLAQDFQRHINHSRFALPYFCGAF